MDIGQCPKPTYFPVAASGCPDLGCGVVMVMSNTCFCLAIKKAFGFHFQFWATVTFT